MLTLPHCPSCNSNSDLDATSCSKCGRPIGGTPEERAELASFRSTIAASMSANSVGAIFIVIETLIDAIAARGANSTESTAIRKQLHTDIVNRLKVRGLAR